MIRPPGKEAVVTEKRIGRSQKIGVVIALAFAGWAGCAAIMGIGMSVTSLQTTLVVHAIGAPIIFAFLSLLFFTRFNYSNPLAIAIVFTAFVMAVDFFVVALVIQRSISMFSSILGTWLPFALIFFSTYSAGLYETRHRPTVTKLSGTTLT